MEKSRRLCCLFLIHRILRVCLFQDSNFGFSSLPVRLLCLDHFFIERKRDEIRDLVKEMYYQLTKSSYRDSLKILEADIEHANGL